MSRFVDKLNNLSKDTLPAMGFHKIDTAEKRMSLLAAIELQGKSEDEIKELAATDVTAGVFNSAGLSSSTLAKYVKNRGNLILGLIMANGSVGNASKLIDDDIDFIVFDINMPVKVLNGRNFETVGKILKLDATIDTGLLRSVNALYPRIDAVLLDLRVSPLTFDNLMNCRRVSDFTGQHMIAQVSKTLMGAELMALCASGVKCLLMPSDTSAAELKSTIDEISALPKPEKRKERKDIALLPRIEPVSDAREEDDNGDDDD